MIQKLHYRYWLSVSECQRAEKLRNTQRVHAKWSETYDDRDDVEANDASCSNAESPPQRTTQSATTAD